MPTSRVGESQERVREDRATAGNEPAGQTGAASDGKQVADAQAGDAALRRIAGGPAELPPDVRAGLERSFGRLPQFEVVVDAAQVPDGARAASDGKRVLVRSVADLSDLRLVAHEVAHVMQLAGRGVHGADVNQAAGPDAAQKVGPGGAIDAAQSHAPEDEKGAERQSVEQIADRAAADVEAGRKIEDMEHSPVQEGEMYLDSSGAGPLAAQRVRLVLFPGESTDGDTTRGHLYVYVDGKLVKSYPACGGPPPGQGHADRGGHTAGDTPAGNYVLGSAQHHTTTSWPMSVVPWGAQIRQREDGDIEYSPDQGKSWIKATGDGGTVTNAAIAFEQRTRASAAAAESQRTGKPVKPTPLTDEEKHQYGIDYRSVFYNDDGSLMTTYTKNDFGKWAFDLLQQTKQGLQGTPYYVHTTPDDEAETAAGGDPSLHQSHGCIHIKPTDRAEMMQDGYLQRGVKLVVKPYGVQGP